MKIKLRFFKVLAVLSIMLASSSCVDETEMAPKLEGQHYTFDELFEYVANEITVDNDEHALYIDYNYEKGCDKIVVTKIEQKEPEMFILTSSNDKLMKRNYTVECENGDNSWTQDCDGKFSCGSLIVDYIDKGGCATMCGGQIIYSPPIRHFVTRRRY